jgi:cytochrome b involved in lipid metabolism
MAGVYYRQAGGADKKADGQTSNGLLLLFEVMFGVSGRVYNITPYLEFHPGGVDEIMRGAGKDGTQLFNEIHKWVNVESMLASCYIGPLKAKTKAKAKARRTHNPNTESKTTPIQDTKGFNICLSFTLFRQVTNSCLSNDP